MEFPEVAVEKIFLGRIMKFFGAKKILCKEV